jgi:uncharacterized protein (TIGR02246 family)
MDDRASLRHLIDRTEISDLLLAMCAALDAKDWEAYAATFTDNATFKIMGQTRRGREAIAAGPVRDLQRYQRLQHFSANHRITIVGDEAKASHYLIGVHIPNVESPELHADIGGRYDCRCIRTGDGWRLQEVELSVLWARGDEFGIEEVGDE